MKIFENTKKWLTEANPTPIDIKTIRKWINEELDEFEDALEKNNKQEMYDAVIDAVTFLANIPYFYDLDIEELSKVADAVNQSNWSKFCKTEQEAIDTVEAYANGTHPNKIGEKIKTYYTYADKYFIIKKVLDNKIVKSINFIDTEQFL
jgi:NTP pyrophosphatase (non-canonical NTP hydrolase)